MAIACETLIDGLLLGALYALFGLRAQHQSLT